MSENTNGLLRALRMRSPAGFAAALHIQFTTPRYLFQAYNKDWLDHYSAQGLVMQDPTVQWAFANTGAVRWSALAAEDTAGVLAEAAKYGLRYGVTIAVSQGGTRSMASFARSDREMSDLDMRALSRDFSALHTETAGTMIFDPEIHTTLKQLSIFLTRG